MTDRNHVVLIVEGAKPLKMWTKGVPVEHSARTQLINTASMPFIHSHVAVMPDVHLGIGATVGSVVATDGAIIPAAVGVDIGCGMIAQQLSLKASDLPDNLSAIRSAIESVVPHGRTNSGGSGDRGAWGTVPAIVDMAWATLSDRFAVITAKNERIGQANQRTHLGTMGGGNHFLELCLDENDNVWIMLHSGSRGIGNRIGSHFIRLAKQDMERHFINLPDKDLSYLVEGSEHFNDYVEGVGWAQDFARVNRELMMAATVQALHQHPDLPTFSLLDNAVNCHHNYISRERHFGKSVHVTRKGAVRAQEGDIGIIPGSMGARSFIVRGKGNRDSFNSCSHGAGRVMSRTEARNTFTVDDVISQTKGIECKKDESILDEAPRAYKDIDVVMAAQADLVDIVHTLKQVLCIKG